MQRSRRQYPGREDLEVMVLAALCEMMRPESIVARHAAASEAEAEAPMAFARGGESRRAAERG